MDQHPRSSRALPIGFLLFTPVALLAAFAPARPARAATAAEVGAAIGRGRDALYGTFNPKQGWELTPAPDPKGGPADPKGKQWGGRSAMAVYALLAAGEKAEDKRLAPAINFVLEAPIVGNYALGLRCQLYPLLPQNEKTLATLRRCAQRDAGMLMRSLWRSGGKDGDKRVGFYPYWSDPAAGPTEDWYDRSVSQYGVLGMWACEQSGLVEVPLSYWQAVDAAWKGAEEKQAPGAGWRYRHDRNDQNASWNNMTAAGIATLFITQDYMLQGNAWGTCRGGTPNPYIDQGMAYMDAHIGEMLSGSGYGMYGIERIGVASGRKYFGTVPWYQTGADSLVGRGGGAGWGDVPETVFAMLFLIRGRAPIVMNKLEYELTNAKSKTVPMPWNERPRDAANFAHWSGRMTERYLNWQIVNLKVAADDLHDAPILYISGSQPLDFDDTAVGKLRDFVEGGGLILANADCGNEAFTKSITGPDGLGKRLFRKYEFRKLPENHLIYTGEIYHRAKWKTKPDLVAMTNGVRELIIVVPDADLGRSWQTRTEKTRPEQFELAQNLFMYATSKSEIRFRGETYLVKPDPKAVPVRSARVVRIDAGENPDPEPGGWPRMVNVARNQAKLAVTVETAKLGAGKLAGATVAHLTGTENFKLSDEQRAELKDYVAKGGTLVVDAAGGANEFATAAERELAATFGGNGIEVGEVLPPEHIVYAWPGLAVDKTLYREYVRGKISGKLNAPRVRGITVPAPNSQGGRIGVFYSREDLSAGLVGQPVDGILGYTPEASTAIMRNILLYAAVSGQPGGLSAVAGQAPPAPASQPATQPATQPAGGGLRKFLGG